MAGAGLLPAAAFAQNILACTSALTAVAGAPPRAAELVFASGRIESGAALLALMLNGSADATAFVSSGFLNDLGSPDACAAVPEAHLCVASANPVLRFGLCLPRACGATEISALLSNVTTAAAALTAAASTNETPASGAEEFSFGDDSAFSLAVDCGDHSRRWSAGAVAVVASFGFAAALGLVGALLDAEPQLQRLLLPSATPADRATPGPRKDAAGVNAYQDEKEDPGALAPAATVEGVDWAAAPVCADFGDDQADAAAPLLRALQPARPPPPHRPPQSSPSKRLRKAVAAAVIVLECFSLARGIDTLSSPRRRSIRDRVGGGSGVGGGGGGVKTGDRQARLEFLDGVRVLSLFWVIMGHVLVFVLASVGYSNLPNLLPNQGDGLLAKWWAQPLMAAFFAVDSFLFVSAFLVGVALLPRLYRIGGPGSGRSGRGGNADGCGGCRGGGMESGVPGGGFVKLYVAACLHRYLRLTPALMATVLFYWQVLPRLGSGPLWGSLDAEVAACDRYWWTNPAYVMNLVPLHDLPCYPVGWYLGLDVQLFLLSPPLLFLYVRRPAAGAAAVLALTIASIAFSAWFSAEYHLSPSIFDPHFVRSFGGGGRGLGGGGGGGGGITEGGDSGGGTAYLPDYYFRPWCRAPAYLIGLLAAFCWDCLLPGGGAGGYCDAKNGAESGGRGGGEAGDGGESAGGGGGCTDLVRDSSGLSGGSAGTSGADDSWKGCGRGGLTQVAAAAGMQDEAAASIRLPEAGALGLAAAWLLLLGSTCYGGYWMYQDIPSGLPQWVLTLYLSLSKPAWAAGLAALSLLCAAGRGGFAGWLLSRPFWAPLSRLNYSMYLAHPVAIYWLYFSRTSAVHYTGIEYGVTFLGVLGVTFLLALPLYLLVERPFQQLEAALLPALAGRR